NPEKGGHVLRALAQRIPEQQFVAVRGAYGELVDYDGLDNVEVLAQVPGEEMAERVYGRTRVLLMPSSYESWGR
ncbi:glycosyl transferase, partial [Streptomyces sp. A73]|nr:glycosyl transferase [Streptomyces sp. A73]MBQ1166072.1 glycosyl transferase [Streptomyces sp. A73]